MKEYDDKHIKNVAFVGAHKCGKTTLAETMLFEAGLIPRRGTVEAKNTVSDFHKIEQEREATIFATPLHTEWRNYKINIIDTPGMDDFIGETASTIRIADTVVLIINARQGVEVGTEIIWNYVDQFQKPTLVVINQIDHPKANFDDSYKSVVDLVGKNAVVAQYPYTLDGAQCIIDVVKMIMYKYGKNGGKPEKLPIPDSEKERAEDLHNKLVEKAAENDEGLMELFFEKGTLNEEELRQGIKLGMLHHDVFPVFCLSALLDMGPGRLMGFIDNVAPSASDLKPELSVEGDEVVCQPEAPTALFIFKTLYEPNFGQITFFKVKSGTIKQGDKVFNSRTGQETVINQLFIMDGNNRTPVQRLNSGDIGATLKLKQTETNDTLHSPAKKITIQPISFPEPRISKAIFPINKRDEEKLNEVLRKLHSQDPTIVVNYIPELRQVIVSCQGELHLSVLEYLLKNEHGIEVKFVKPRIAYRETIEASAIASYKHKKQSGGAGQFAEVHLKVEPWYEGMPAPADMTVRGVEEIKLPWGGLLVFCNCIVGGVIDARFLPSIKKGILEVMERGPMTGSHARDIRVMVFDGKMHPVDSNDISFKIAAAHAFKAAFLDAKPKLLEPIYELQVNVPEDKMGDIISDLQLRRSVILNMDGKGKYQTIKAKTALAELYQYSTTLRSITQGKGSFTSNFAEYALVPGPVQTELLKNYQAKQQAGEVEAE